MGSLIRSLGGDGRSAYQTAVDNGYTGTVEDWLALVYRAPALLSIPGKPAAEELLYRGLFTFETAVTTALCGASADELATADTVFVLQHNGGQVGTVTFLAGTAVGVFAWTDTTLAAGVFRVIAPAIPDATLENISITLVFALV